ncbi:MAG: glucose-6-phosphate dehydrogenase (NADP(+)) [Candidatus Moranbacteria bacterium]|nr:glucose-6-phosphate dehydrogenase (NADP(+)) [Candidatus Moranbacteria bacterium]
MHIDKELVLFGASGDLAKEKLYPALFDLFLREEGVRVTGFGRTDFSHEAFRSLVINAVSAKRKEAKQEDIYTFASCFRYYAGTYDRDGMRTLAGALRGTTKKSLFFYLAIPSSYELIRNIIQGLAGNRLLGKTTSLALEKPFGFDLASAKKLNMLLSRHLDESQIYRLDHYLAKDMVRDLFALRFANPVFDPVWNNRYIRDISIVISENEGIRKRAEYYERSGAIRDMLQNHALELLAFTTMEQPKNQKPEDIHREKIRIFRRLRLFGNEKLENIRIGQYDGYRSEPGVSPWSLVETEASIRLEIDTPRWRGIPITIATGKKMPKKTTDITVTFKKPEHTLWEASGCALAENRITINIQPKNEISLRLNSEFSTEKKCAYPADLRFAFADNAYSFKDPYDNALHDFFAKDQGTFLNAEEILLSWKFIDQVLAVIDPVRKKILEKY